MTLSFSIHILPMDYGAITTGNKKEPAMGFQKFDDGNQYSNQPHLRSFMGAVFLPSFQVQNRCTPRHYRRAFSSLVISSKPGRPSRANILFVLAGRFHRPHRSHECCNGRLLADCIGCVACFVGTSCQRFYQRLFLLFTQSCFLYPGHHLVRSSAQNKNLPVGGRRGRRSG